MKNEFNKIEIEDSIEVQRSKNKTEGIIVTIVFCAIVLFLGISEHGPIVATIWSMFIFVLSGIITFNIVTDLSLISSRLIFGAIFFSLFFISALLNMVIRLIGLDLLQWTF